MVVDPELLQKLVASEIGRIEDKRVLDQIEKLRVEPVPILRNWDYGEPGEQFECWAILCDPESDTGIVYCEYGFGPRCPWGLVALAPNSPMGMSMGMDSGWFLNFLDAYFDSYAVTRLPIWRVVKDIEYKDDQRDGGELITDECSWEEAWEKIYELRKRYPDSRFDCDHGIRY